MGSWVTNLTPQVMADAIRNGYQSFSDYREQRKTSYDRTWGRHYNKPVRKRVSTEDRAQPINLSLQQVRTLAPRIAMKNPRVSVGQKSTLLELDARLIKAALDQEAESLKLGELYLTATIDFMIGGIALSRTGLKTSTKLGAAHNEGLDPGETYETLFSFDDWCCDPYARSFQEMRWEAYRTRVSKSKAIEQGLYGQQPGVPQVNGNVATPEEAAAMIEGAHAVHERIGTSSGHVEDLSMRNVDSGSYDDVDEQFEVWHIIVYDDGQTYEFAMLGGYDDSDNVVDVSQDKFLMAVPYDGPEEGPIDRLTALPVPFNLLPLSLEQMQADLALVADLLANKLIQQLLRAKSNLLHKPSNRDEALTLLKARDGAPIPTSDPTGMVWAKYEPMLKEIVPGIEFVMANWNNATSNMQLAAGTNDVGETATAFSGLMARVEGWLTFLRDRVQQWASRNARRRAWYMLNNPEYATVVPIDLGQGLVIQVPFSTADTEGNYLDFVFEVDAFGSDAHSPELKATRLIELFQGVVPVLIEMHVAGLLDGLKALRILSKHLDLPELEQVLPDAEALMQSMAEMQALGQPPGAELPSQRPPGAQATPRFGGGNQGATAPTMGGRQQGPGQRPPRVADQLGGQRNRGRAAAAR